MFATMTLQQQKELAFDALAALGKHTHSFDVKSAMLLRQTNKLDTAFAFSFKTKTLLRSFPPQSWDNIAYC